MPRRQDRPRAAGRHGRQRRGAQRGPDPSGHAARAPAPARPRLTDTRRACPTGVAHLPSPQSVGCPAAKQLAHLRPGIFQQICAARSSVTAGAPAGQLLDAHRLLSAAALAVVHCLLCSEWWRPFYLYAWRQACWEAVHWLRNCAGVAANSVRMCHANECWCMGSSARQPLPATGIRLAEHGAGCVQQIAVSLCL